MSKHLTFLDLAEMLRTRTDEHELNQAFWACERGVPYPLNEVDRWIWRDACDGLDETATLASDEGALLRHIEGAWQKHHIRIQASAGKADISVDLSDPSLVAGVSGRFQGALPLRNLSRGLAAAFAQAHGVALDQKARLNRVSDIVEDDVPPIADWPIEEAAPGRFLPVHHGLRLAALEAGSREKAVEFIGMNHKGRRGLMLCRERYEKYFPAPQPGAETPEP
ncbi:hypothetical protein LAZ40_06615 [Cereibacter sphaeroides]|uniref:hypothetical protein n=1 Tax=Cereibacter sphaeroides TaxID=1063 RepID=UPI001F345243|nr:hypothetical protein [Cereibacter sphaeroides]MCE6958718.1 hypothetical protein [Cereibacter sphaeroides]MCE6971206.1 hypothetical protein [Cereibacter sphaeroides]